MLMVTKLSFSMNWAPSRWRTSGMADWMLCDTRNSKVQSIRKFTMDASQAKKASISNSRLGSENIFGSTKMTNSNHIPNQMACQKQAFSPCMPKEERTSFWGHSKPDNWAALETSCTCTAEISPKPTCSRARKAKHQEHLCHSAVCFFAGMVCMFINCFPFGRHPLQRRQPSFPPERTAQSKWLQHATHDCKPKGVSKTPAKLRKPSTASIGKSKSKNLRKSKLTFFIPRVRYDQRLSYICFGSDMKARFEQEGCLLDVCNCS